MNNKGMQYVVNYKDKHIEFPKIFNHQFDLNFDIANLQQVLTNNLLKKRT